MKFLFSFDSVLLRCFIAHQRKYGFVWCWPFGYLPLLGHKFRAQVYMIDIASKYGWKIEFFVIIRDWVIKSPGQMEKWIDGNRWHVLYLVQWFTDVIRLAMTSSEQSLSTVIVVLTARLRSFCHFCLCRRFIYSRQFAIDRLWDAVIWTTNFVHAIVCFSMSKCTHFPVVHSPSFRTHQNKIVCTFSFLRKKKQKQK